MEVCFRIFVVLLVNLLYLMPEGEGVYPGWMSRCFLVGEESPRPREIKRLCWPEACCSRILSPPLVSLDREGGVSDLHFCLLIHLSASP